EALAAQPDLLQRLLSADVQHGPLWTREPIQRGEEQRALSDPGIAGEQHYRAGNQPPSKRAVQFADARPLPAPRRERDLVDGQHGREPASAGASRLLLHRAERAAASALAEPLRRAKAALPAQVLDRDPGHRSILPLGSDMHATC